MIKLDYCPACGNKVSKEAVFCTNCGTPVPCVEKNICRNKSCERCDEGYEFRPDVRFCDQCGYPTSLGSIIEKNI